MNQHNNNQNNNIPAASGNVNGQQVGPAHVAENGAAGNMNGQAPVQWQNLPTNWGPQAYVDPRIIADEEIKFDPLQIFLYVVRYRWVIGIIMVTGLIAGLLISSIMVPKYRADAMIEVEAPSASIIEDLQVVRNSGDVMVFRTALEKLKSREMMQRVVGELRLMENRSFLFPDKGFSFGNLIKRATGKAGKSFSELSSDERERKAIKKVSAGMNANLLRGTSIISITFANSSPDLARKVTNQFANSYISSKLDQTAETSRLARQFIGEQVTEVKKRLETAEKTLVSYAKTNGITFNDKDGSLTAANIKSINEAMSLATQDRLKFERLVAQIKAGKVIGLEDVQKSETIQQTRIKIAELKGDYSQKLSTFKPSYPEMRELAAQIKQLNHLLNIDIKSIASSIRQKHQIAILKESDLRIKLKELEGNQVSFQEKNIKYTILKREVDSFRSQYKSLIDKLNQLGVASEIKNKSATIIQYAVTPHEPFSPRILLNLALALIGSLLTAGAVVYVLELMNNTFSNPDQLENELKLPVLGIIPKFTEQEMAEQAHDPRSALSESFRTLRTALQFTGISGAPRSLMITSTAPSEGKSTITQLLAENFGQLNLKVLIIDADMRRPTQHRIAGIPNSLGLSNLLTNTVHVSQVDAEVEIMRNTPWENVWLVTAGTPPPNPADLLSSQKMGLFIEACTNRFDIVIIDSPPVIGLADALLLSRLTEATMLTVKAQGSSRKAVQNALNRLKSSAGHIVGTTLNQFHMDNIEYKYSYNYLSTNYLNYGAEDYASANTANSTYISSDKDETPSLRDGG